jgi:prephenate dehydrogenase
LTYARAALIGTGMIGSSFLGALRRAGTVERAVGYDLSAETGARALKAGIVDELAADPAQAARGADLVVLAVPVRATASVCEALSPALAAAPDVLVTDVGSTKSEVLAAVERWLPFPERFVGAHPIAGTERSGPEAADPGLFRGRRCLVTPGRSTRLAAVEACETLWRAAGAEVERIDVERHDEILAHVSHLPHAAAFALARAVGRVDAAGLSGGGFVDTTRIAASDPVMWRDVFLSNREPLLRALERLDEELGELRRAVAAQDGAALVEIIEGARAARRRVLDGRGRS